ncbi:MAG: invasion associated locus B family protein [Zetaproteobacteria bacterium]|nr:invasion associated locus B family protein [Zetaproteobacteria bacterium]
MSNSTAGSVQVHHGQSFGQWVLLCQATGPNRTVCALQQIYFQDESQQALAGGFVFQKIDAAHPVQLVLQTPCGVEIPAGVKWQLDQGPEQDAFYNTCAPQGGIVILPLDDMLLRLMLDAKMITLYYVVNGQTMAVQGSTEGLTDAFQALGWVEAAGTLQ